MKEFLNINELSECLGIKKSTLYAKVSSNQIPHYKIDRLVRFKKTEIDEWINQRKSKAPQTEQNIKRTIGSLEKQDVNLSKIFEKCIEKKTSPRYNPDHRETRPKSLKGGSYGTF
jgi:excisionase family DNA binding protein